MAAKAQKSCSAARVTVQLCAQVPAAAARGEQEGAHAGAHGARPRAAHADAGTTCGSGTSFMQWMRARSP